MNNRPTSVIGIFGPSCSGKSTIARALEDIGWKEIDLSSMVKFPDGSLVRAAPWERIQEEVPDCYNQFGKTFFIDQLSEILASASSRLVITGLRNQEEAQWLLRIGSLKLVHVTASFRIRLKRKILRDGLSAEICNQHLRRRDNADSQWGMNSLLTYDALKYTTSSDSWNVDIHKIALQISELDKFI